MGQCKEHFGAREEDEDMPWFCLPATLTAGVWLISKGPGGTEPWLSGGEPEEIGGHGKEKERDQVLQSWKGPPLLSSPFYN